MKSAKIFDAAKEAAIYYLLKLIPKQYREQSTVLHSLFKWFLLGLFIRLLLMPFAFHGDLLSTYHRSYLLIFSGDMQFFNPHEIIQAVSIWMFSFVTPVQDFLIWNGSETVTTWFWLGTLENPYIFRTIFLMKIPYLIFDILICILLLHIFKNEVENGLRAFIFWIVNPIIIFAVYIFGRYEVIPIFFILAGIYFLKENHIYFAALSLGIAIWSRYYALLFLPLLLILYGRTWIEKIKMVSVIVFPLIVYDGIIYFLQGELKTIGFFGGHFVEYLLGMNFSIGYSETIYLFVVGYTGILLYAYYAKRSKNTFIDFTAYSLIILLLMYATSIFHPHYFAWFIPFLALYYGYTNNRSLIELHCLQVICFVFFTFYWGQSLSTWLFASINSGFITLPSPLGLIEQIYPSLTALNIMRSIFSAVLLFMAVNIIIIQRRGTS